jgi:hypothetical protein
MRKLPPGVVTPLHIELLCSVAMCVDQFDAGLGIRLDGGMALAAFYLDRRQSGDLDFMVTPSASANAALYDGFPLRMLKPVHFSEVATTATYCASVVAEQLAEALRSRSIE